MVLKVCYSHSLIGIFNWDKEIELKQDFTKQIYIWETERAILDFNFSSYFLNKSLNWIFYESALLGENLISLFNRVLFSEDFLLRWHKIILQYMHARVKSLFVFTKNAEFSYTYFNSALFSQYYKMKLLEMRCQVLILSPV